MSLPNNNSQRKIIPRWRDFVSTIRLGELKDTTNAQAKQVVEGPLSEHGSFHDWKQDPSLWNALDLIGSAIVTNELPLVEEALEQARNDPSTPELARKLLEDLKGGSDFLAGIAIAPPPIDFQQISSDIRRLRIHLANYPWNAIEWTELARNYTTLGIKEKAERALLVALQLAPANRYVLRSAARFFVHIGDLERAHELLFRSANTAFDPWLLASEIAISSAMGRASRLAKLGQGVLRKDIRPSDLTELASALGTLESEGGNNRGAKKFLRQALAGANENSVAQIEWLKRNRLGDIIDTSAATPPLLYEANAWAASAKGDWNNALLYSLKWFRDQPFSTHPATLCTFLLADILEEYQKSCDIAVAGLRANSAEPMLLNNYAYALINLGKLNEAEEVLKKIDFEKHPEGFYKLILATFGLLEFRRGNSEKGRQYYLEAIEEAKKLGDKVRSARASIYLAMEEIRARTAHITAAIKRAFEDSKGIKSSEVAFKLTQLEASSKTLTRSGQ